MNNINVITLNEENLCIGWKSVAAGYILQEREMITESNDTSVVGKTYDPDTGEFYYAQTQIENEAKAWRDSELSRTDSLMLLPDYPYKEQLTAYRQVLRDWPSTTDFPDTRPELGE